MEVTLLGSGDAVGVPAPLCDCEYCLASDRRRRPGVLVENGETSLVFDVGPDVAQQLHEVGVYDVDAFFATHAHFDHYWGVRELAHAAMDEHLGNEEAFDHPTFGKQVTVRGSRAVRTFTRDRFPDVLDHVDYEPIDPGERADVGAFTVEAFDLDHGDSKFLTQGYAVTADGTTVGYAPDVDRMRTVPDPCTGVDLLFFDGSVLGAEIHGEAPLLRAAVDDAGADRVVLTHVSEHLLERHTDDVVGHPDYEVWADFDAAAF